MIEIRPIQDGDMEYVQADCSQESVKFYGQLVPRGDAVTVIFDGDIVAVGGLVKYWEGVGEVWLMLTEKSRKKGVFGIIALEAISKKMNELIVAHNLWRVEANVRADFPESIKMIKYFGFEYEGTKRKYTPDKCNMLIFSRIRND